MIKLTFSKSFTIFAVFTTHHPHLQVTQAFKVNRAREAFLACQACLVTQAQEGPRVTGVTQETRVCLEWENRGLWDPEACPESQGHQEWAALGPWVNGAHQDCLVSDLQKFSMAQHGRHVV